METFASPLLLLASSGRAAHAGVIHSVIHLIYIFAAVMFILSLHWMSDPKTARRGTFAGVAGMAAAVLGTLVEPEIVRSGYLWIAIAALLAVPFGIKLSMVPLTAVPQRTALSHAFGGLAAGLVGTAEYFIWLHDGAPAAGMSGFKMGAIVFEVLLGFITVTGSLMAAGKLQEIIPTRPITYKNQNAINLLLFVIAIVAGVTLVLRPSWWPVYALFAGLALTFGVLLIIPIGGADMPTVISILNSYAGLSAVAMGFVLDNKLLITAGALDGSSGLILSIIMCKAMNRSFFNVLFGAFGQVQAAAAATTDKSVRSTNPEEVAQMLEMANEVAIIPGYGMAVAQAQRMVRELYDQLTKRGVVVKFAIHPVAGRMPGHMNVLLAEVEIPYDRLIDMETINPEFPQVDVALVVGANDVTNPAARHDKSSPIYGMPILDVDKAKTIIVNKRSMNPGFAGIDNELYYNDKTLMLFGDSKAALGDVVKALSGGGMH